MRDIFAEVHEQVQNGIKYSCYPYNQIDSLAVEDDDTCILYQRDLREIGEFGGLTVEQLDIRQNKAASQAILDIQILDGEEGLKYVFDYSASRYKEDTMIAFQKLFGNIVTAIVNNADTDGYSFKELKGYVRGKKNLLQKLKDIFSKNK